MHETCVAARLDAAAHVRLFLERAAADSGLTRAQALKLQLIAEELFVNTVRHGHRGDHPARVWLALEAREGVVHLTYTDHAPPFNSLAAPLAPAPRDPHEDHRVGGLGVHLVRELVSGAEYAYLYGRNRLRLVLRT